MLLILLIINFPNQRKWNCPGMRWLMTSIRLRVAQSRRVKEYDSLQLGSKSQDYSLILFANSELEPDSVVKIYLITAADGKSYDTKH